MRTRLLPWQVHPRNDPGPQHSTNDTKELRHPLIDNSILTRGRYVSTFQLASVSLDDQLL